MSFKFYKYAINIAIPKAEVQLIDRTICIPVGEARGLTQKETEHEDVIYAMRRGWIDLVDEEPKVEPVIKPEIKIEQPAPLGSKEPPVAKKAETKAETKSTTIGKTEPTKE